MKIIAKTRYCKYDGKGVQCTEAEKRTKQHFTDDCDVNKILDKFSRTGILPESKPKMYGDFSNVQDYVTAFAIVQNAHTQFGNLDADIRARFHNDPSEFLNFATNENNAEEMVKLVLATKRPVEAVKTQPEAKAEASTSQSEVKI